MTSACKWELIRENYFVQGRNDPNWTPWEEKCANFDEDHNNKVHRGLKSDSSQKYRCGNCHQDTSSDWTNICPNALCAIEGLFVKEGWKPPNV